MENTLTEGFAYVLFERKDHYFRNGLSLCGIIGVEQQSEYDIIIPPAYRKESKYCCSLCRKQLSGSKYQKGWKVL